MRIVLGLLILFLTTNVYSWADDVTTVEATSSDISDNLDLEAIASLFGEVKDLEEFEQRLNDPKARISNLDLNEDGEVDYLRVVETSKGDTHLISIQAVIGKDQYQDVATIDVEKDKKGETRVQVVGDVYMYGPGYIVEPVYVHPPVIFVFFWGPLYHPWHSPFYWGFYPPYYHPWRPYPTYRYRQNVRINVNINNTYKVTSIRKSKTAVELQKKSRRNDFGRKYPDRSFAQRNSGIKNKTELNREVKKSGTDNSKKGQIKKSTGVPVQKDWKPASKRVKTPSKGNTPSSISPGNKKTAPVKDRPSRTKQLKNTRPKQQMGRPLPRQKSTSPRRNLR